MAASHAVGGETARKALQTLADREMIEARPLRRGRRGRHPGVFELLDTTPLAARPVRKGDNARGNA